jgi:hypothetical protein
MAYGSPSGNRKKSALKGLFETPALPKPKKKKRGKIGGLNDWQRKRIEAQLEQFQREIADEKTRDFLKSLMKK